jgi:thioredoxin 1
MLTVNDDTWDADVAEGLCIVEVWATWCDKCEGQKALFEELEPQYPDVRFLSANLDDNMRHAYRLRIGSVPTALFYVDGRLMDEAEGVQIASSLKRRIEHWQGVAEKTKVYEPIRV